MKRVLAAAGALTLTLAATTAGLLTQASAAHAATAGTKLTRPADTGPVMPVSVRQLMPGRYTVRSGDNLSVLAARYCHGTAADWTGFYRDNRVVIGGNPNLILIGQKLNLYRCTAPVVHWYSAPVVHQQVQHVQQVAQQDYDPSYAGSYSYSGSYSYAGLEALWVAAGGPAWAAAHAAEIAMCESGGNVYAYNPSGATGLWQILGAVVPGNLDNPYVNALNAVSKFRASGDTFAQWVCQ